MKPLWLLAAKAPLLLTLLFPGVVSAHTLFLKPETPHPAPDGALSILLMNGTFWESEAVLRQSRLADLRLVDPDSRARKIDLEHWRVADGTSMVDVNLGEEGTYVFGAATKPSLARLPAEEFNRYLHYEGLKDQYLAREALGESQVAVSERYTKFAKAVVQVGQETTGSFRTPLDHKVEIVPLVNPGALRVGDTFKARIYFDGQPLAGERVFVSSGNTKLSVPDEGPLETLQLVSAEDGGIEFDVTEPGSWYVRFIRLERLGDSEYWYSDFLVWLGVQDPRVPYESFWATLTFRIP
jgi:hypothetical protein